MCNLCKNKGTTSETIWEFGTLTDTYREVDDVTMDFIMKLPKTKSGHDKKWVVVHQLTKSEHFVGP